MLNSLLRQRGGVETTVPGPNRYFTIRRLLQRAGANVMPYTSASRARFLILLRALRYSDHA